MNQHYILTDKEDQKLVNYVIDRIVMFLAAMPIIVLFIIAAVVKLIDSFILEQPFLYDILFKATDYSVILMYVASFFLVILVGIMTLSSCRDSAKHSFIGTGKTYHLTVSSGDTIYLMNRLYKTDNVFQRGAGYFAVKVFTHDTDDCNDYDIMIIRFDMIGQLYYEFIKEKMDKEMKRERKINKKSQAESGRKDLFSILGKYVIPKTEERK